MKIITYNMQHDKKSKDNWSAILEATDPDVLLAQEALHPSPSGRPLLEVTWSEQVVWCPAHGDWGSAVYVKSQQPRPLELPDYRGWVVGVELDNSPLSVNGRPLRVFSLHAPTGQGNYPRVVGKILDMVQEQRDGCDVIIGGDFNLTVSRRHDSEERRNKPVNLAIQARLRDEFGLINCWQTMHPDLPLAQTLRWDTNPLPSYHCDGIFVPASWASRLVRCDVLTGERWLGLSDHNPIVAEFE